MAIQMNITTEGLAKFRAALETGNLETLKTAKFYGGWSGGAVSGSVVATLDIAVNKAIESNSNVCRFICQDKSDAEYTTYGGEVINADGVVVATFNNGGKAVATKQSKAEMMLGFEIKFEDNTAASSVINMGDTTFIFDDATETAAGIIELATEAEAKAGTDAKRAITPKTLDAVIKSHAEVVHRSGTETITGNKTFTGNLVLSNVSPFFHVSQIDIVKGEQPASSQYMGIAFVDSTGQATANRLGVIETKYLADGSVCLSICAYKPEGGSTASVSLDLVYPVNGTPYITVPTPAFGDASTKIATTAWVKAVADKLLPLVGGVLTGALTISKGDLTLTEGIIKKGVKTNGLDICSGTSYEDSPALSLYPTDYAFDEGMRGRFVLRAGANTVQLVGTADGTLTWDGADLRFQAPKFSAKTTINSGTTYTAATNGFIFLDIYAKATLNVTIAGNSYQFKDFDYNSFNTLLPVRKGMAYKVNVTTTAAGGNGYVRHYFVPAM